MEDSASYIPYLQHKALPCSILLNLCIALNIYTWYSLLPFLWRRLLEEGAFITTMAYISGTLTHGGILLFQQMECLRRGRREGVALYQHMLCCMSVYGILEGGGEMRGEGSPAALPLAEKMR